jgi:hypothetical protein
VYALGVLELALGFFVYRAYVSVQWGPSAAVDSAGGVKEEFVGASVVKPAVSWVRFIRSGGHPFCVHEHTLEGRQAGVGELPPSLHRGLQLWNPSR